MNLDTSVSVLRGVGPVVKRGLDMAGVETMADLLNYFPFRWEDYSQVVKIAGLRPGPVTIRARVETVLSRRAFRRNLTITEAILADDTGTTKAVWFNQPYVMQQLREGEEYFFSGNFEFKSNNLSLQQPSHEPATSEHKGGKIVPIYHENKILTSGIIQKLMAQVLPLTDQLEDDLPESMLASQGLMDFGEAIRQLHQPESMSELERARERLGFEELFFLILTGLTIKAEIQTEQAPEVVFDQTTATEFISRLPFKLTAGQKKSAWQILQDLERPHAMNRLLKGDVGSGKTIVATMAAVMAIRAGYQVSLMVPTEILARQHHKSLTKILEPLGIEPTLLVAGLKPAEKREIQAQITAGEAKLVIGTHALLAQKVDFHNLGLVIIDEQHRFGVEQRRELKTKAGKLPHLLSMTATPIPRSLALVIYGDLDLSTINELPPGRKPIKTKLVAETDRDSTMATIDELIDSGQQVFVVCPLIEESDKLGVKSVTAEYDRLQKTIFAHRRIGLVHGRLKADEKQQVMQDFAAGKLDILIATSVIEVGIDVPRATVMIIEGADRFGLAALHQLRGRVGRSDQQSYCYLFTDSGNPATIQRLKALERTNDGFRLAQIDLEMRGPGEIYGRRQSGELDLRIANVLDAKLIERAKSQAEAFMKTENVVEYHRVLSRINRLKSITTLD